MLGQVTVVPQQRPLSLEVYRVAVVVVGVVVALVTLIADGTSIEIQVLIVLLNCVCASESDRYSVSLVKYFISPFIDEGSTWAMAGNVCIALGFLLMH